MNSTLQPGLERKTPCPSEAEGITVEVYLERLVRAEQQAEDEIEALAREGLVSGEPLSAGPDYWEDKHRRLDERLNEQA